MFELFKIKKDGTLEPHATGWRFKCQQTAEATAVRLSWQGVPHATARVLEDRGRLNAVIVSTTSRTTAPLIGTWFDVKR